MRAQWLYERFEQGSVLFQRESPPWPRCGPNMRNAWRSQARRMGERFWDWRQTYGTTDVVYHVALYLSQWLGSADWSDMSEAEQRMWTREATAVMKEVERAYG